MTTDLVQYNAHLANLRATVERLDTVDEAKELADKAAAAQTWARRVRLGEEAINHAAEVKIRAERRAGELITVLPKNPGGRPSETTSRQEAVSTLPDLGVTHKQSHEWQALAAVPEERFDAAIEEAKAEGEITRAGVLRRSMDVHYSSETDNWSTPPELFAALHAEFGFELDVCASDGNAKCGTYYTREQDGLSQPWTGVCWMNPPYGLEIARWVQKAYESGENGATVVCLVPARVDTGWWWDYCRYGEIRILRGRLKFGGGDTGAPFPSAVVIFGRPANAVAAHWDWKAAA